VPPGRSAEAPAHPDVAPPVAPRPASARPAGGARRPAGPLARLALPVGVVGVVLACLMAWRAALRTGVFDDTFWHRAAGVWMLDHHRVVTHDVFTYTVAGRSWISPEWGYDVVLAWSMRTFGAGALWFFSAGLATVTVAVVVLVVDEVVEEIVVVVVERVVVVEVVEVVELTEVVVVVT